MTYGITTQRDSLSQEGLRASWVSLRASWEGLRASWEGLRASWEGPKARWEAPRGGRTETTKTRKQRKSPYVVMP